MTTCVKGSTSGVKLQGRKLGDLGLGLGYLLLHFYLAHTKITPMYKHALLENERLLFWYSVDSKGAEVFVPFPFPLSSSSMPLHYQRPTTNEGEVKGRRGLLVWRGARGGGQNNGSGQGLFPF